MSSRAAVTVMRPRPQVEELWRDPAHRPPYIDGAHTEVRFLDAPGDRGTEIHVELLTSAPGGKLGETVQKMLGTEPLARVKDDLRRFKQRVETGEIPRSDANPGGESLQSKLRQRPAQPLTPAERQKVAV
jgi:hypothetical protein